MSKQNVTSTPKQLIRALCACGLSLWVWLFAVSCVSRSSSDERFDFSATLSNPILSGVALSNNEVFSFAIVGDMHVGGGDTSRLERILNSATASGDAFLVLLGDIVDKGEVVDYQAVLSTVSNLGWDNRVVYVIGNHDIFYDGGNQYLKYFGPSHFSLSVGNSRLIALDTADGMVGEEQASWLNEQLRQRGNEKNTFILSHYMPAVPNIRTHLKLSNFNESLKLMKLAANHSVRGWFGAHYHSFVLGNEEGVDYVVAGGGGGRRMEPLKEYFYVRVSVDGENTSYSVQTVE